VGRRWSLALTLLLTATVLALVPMERAMAAESLRVTKSAADNVLVGGVLDVSVSAVNNGDRPEFNLSFRDHLPPGVTYVGGSTRPEAAGEPRVVTVGGRQVLVWENVSDLPLGAEQRLDFRVRADASVHPVGSRFDNVAQAYASADPRTMPRFDGAGAYTTGASVQGVSNAADSSVTAITIDKSEPSPEHELVRGLHRHSTEYTLTVTNNTQHDDDDVVVVDHLPAQLELLGCGTADHTPGGAVEYPGAPRLDVSTPDVADCRAPASVDTVGNPAGLPAGVYTRVEWRLGTLAPGEVVRIVYRAAIPQRANVLQFPSGRPSAASGQQGANLDNNTGAPTRETSTEQVVTNRVSVSATYTGPVAAGTSRSVGDTADLTVTAEDLAVHKSVSPGRFRHGGIATYTLTVRTGEYADASDIVITDVLPDGLCPLDATTNHAPGSPAPCAPSSGNAPSHAYDTVTSEAGGTTRIVFRPVAVDASGTLQVTYRARMLASYRGGAAAPTVAGDSYTNRVSLVGDTTTLASVAAPGGVSTERVVDESAATLDSDAPQLSKLIQPNPGSAPADCATSASAYVDSATLAPAQTTFNRDSRVCFLLRVDFPEANETRNAVLADFLPDHLTFESVAPLGGNTVDYAFDPATTTFALGTLRGGDRFVPVGGTAMFRISGIVNRAPSTTPDVTGNLAKLTWQNTAGTVGFLRSRQDFSVAPAPPVSVVKAANRITATAPGTAGQLPDSGSPGATQRVRAGDVVQFTVTTRNDGAAANRNAVPVVGPTVWDRLPVGIRCAQVSMISDGGVCTDPGQGGHPSFVGNGTRSAIVWDRPRTVTIAPGATMALTYRVTYPATVSATRSYVNDADVVGYESVSNRGTFLQHHPTGNPDTTVPTGAYDVPRAHDSHTLATPLAGVTKTNETSVDDATQGADPAGLNYATIGETVNYTVLGTVPARTTVYDGVLTDTTPTGLRVQSVTFRYRATPTSPWAGLPAGWTAGLPSTGARLTFPAAVTAGAEDVQVQMLITALVTAEAGNRHGVVRTNTARLTSENEAGAALTTRSASSDVTLVEPSPSPLKTAANRAPGAGEVVRFTVTARNANPGNLGQARPVLHDAVLRDCVPAGLAVVAGSVSTTTGSATTGAVGTDGCAADLTPITWQLGDLGWRSEAQAAGGNPWPVLTYDVTVSPAAAGGATYTNTAALSGASMPGAPTVVRTYAATDVEQLTVPGSALVKSVDRQRVPVGGTVEYELSVTLPASVNFYDATIVDTLPAGVSPESVRYVDSSCTYADAEGGSCFLGLPPSADLPPAGQRHGWTLRNVSADPRPRRLQVTYSAVVDVVDGNVAGRSLTNSAVLSWNQTDAPGTPGVDATFDASTTPGTATVTVTEPSLSITKAVGEDAPVPGETFTYTVRVTNGTGVNVSTARNVRILDTVPAGVRVVGPPSEGGVALAQTPGGGTIEWQLGPIEPGQTRELTYPAQLASPAPTDAQVNVAEVVSYTSTVDGGRTYEGPEAEATVSPALPRLEVDKTVLDGPPSYLGEPTRWQIVVTNTGPATAHDVDLTDVLPAGWTYVEGSARVSVAGAPATSREPDPVTGDPVQTLRWDDLGDLDTGERIAVVVSAVPQASVLLPDRVGSAVGHVNAATATAQDLGGPDGSVVTTATDDARTRIDAADLSVVKTTDDEAVAGTDHTWTIRVANGGPDTAVGPFVVTDAAPLAGATASGAGWSCSTTDGTVRCVRTDPASTLASGASFPDITVTAPVPADAAAGTELSNTAEVEGGTHDPDLDDNTDEATSTVTTVSDLGIVKELVGDLVPGSTATYRITARNQGPSYAHGDIVVTDTLPAGLTYDSHTGEGWSLDRTGQTLTFTWTGDAPVPVSALPAIAVVVDVASSVTGAVTNTATVSEPTDPTSGPEATDSDSDTSTAAPSADLGIAKAGDGPVLAGRSATYEITVTNFGPSDAAGPITVTDTLPDALTYDSVDADDAWTCSAAGQVVTCTLPGGLADEDVSTLRLVADVDEGLTGDVENTASVSSPTPDPNPGNDSDTDDSGITVEADLEIVKTLVTSPVVAGDRVTYELAVTNNGPATSPGPIVVTDQLPQALTFISATGTGWSCGAEEQLVTCERAGTLRVGVAAGVITLTASLDPGAAGTTLTNVANVDGPATDPVPDTSTDDAGAVVTEDAEVSVTKTVTGPDPVRAGEETTFQVVVDNLGPSDARGIVVTDLLPDGMTLVDMGGPGWDCEDAVCSRERVLPGQPSPPITVTALVDPGVLDGTTLTNRATVTTSTPGDNPEDNAFEVEVGVVAEADLALTKSHGTGVVTAGEATTYTIEVRNEGPSDAVGPLTVSDTLPEGTSFLSAGAPWTCTPGETDQVECVLAQGLTAGADAPVLEMQVVVAASADEGTITNTATVSSPTTDPVPGNDTDTADVEVQQRAEVSITKSHAGPVRVGDELAFTLQVANAGPSEARDVVVTDDLPAGLDLVRAEGDGWTCTPVGRLVGCALDAPLAPRASAEPVTVVTTVLPEAYPGVDNVATVTTSTTDTDPSDDEAVDPVVVPALVDLAIDKSHRGRLVVGEQATYDLVVTNAGPTPAPGPLTVTDTLPAGLTPVSAAGEGWVCELDGQDVTCIRTEPLGVDATSAVALVVDVLPSAYPQVLNTAAVSSPSEDTDPSNDVDTDEAGVTPTVVLELDKSVAEVRGTRVLYDLTVTNAGPSDTVREIRLRDPLPAGLRLVRVAGDGWSCSSGATLAECSYAGVLAAGASTTVRLVADVAVFDEQVRNVARVLGGGGSSGPVSDEAVVEVPDPDGDVADGDGDGDSDGDADGGLLPDAGGFALWLLVLALGLVGAGGLLLRRRRA
jgi:uncharacterized repeat protein (TIGR01451 family)/fimbrial isopeptide formation D2 family protein